MSGPGAVEVPFSDALNTSTQSVASPIQGRERLDLIDALRGLALAGVLLVNLGAFSLYFFLDDTARAALPTSDFDRVAKFLKGLFIDRKAVTLFSLLFGLGFAIQIERAKAKGASGLHLYSRRTVILVLMGLVHVYLIWWGDILLMYGLLALLLIPFRNISSRALIWGGLVIALVLPPLIAPFVKPLIEGLPSESTMFASSLSSFSSSSYLSVVQQNFAFGNWTYLAWWEDWFFIFGRFLLGYWAGRTLLFHKPVENWSLLRRMFVVAAVIGLVGTAFEAAQETIEARLPETAQGLSLFLLRVAARAGPLGLGIAYACGFALLFLRPAWRDRLRPLAFVGQMALTNYLAQSIICVAIFYGIGLGVGPRYGYAGWLTVWAVFFGAQILVSRWWLERYRFGPMEWLWRSLTYGRMQPFKLAIPDASTRDSNNLDSVQR